MRHIKKEQEPKEFKQLKKLDKDANFATLKNDKNANFAVKFALAKETGFVCCYCMQEIKNDSNHIVVQIEHFKPKDKNKFPELQLEYSNLLACCFGNQDGENQHCGAKKENEELKYIPNSKLLKAKDFNLKIKYSYTSGKISSSDKDIDNELNEILGLNEQNLKNKRKGKWKEISKKLVEASGRQKDWNKSKKAINLAEKLIERYNKKRRGENTQGKQVYKHYPFYDFVVYSLKKRFKNELLNK